MYIPDVFHTNVEKLQDLRFYWPNYEFHPVVEQALLQARNLLFLLDKLRGFLPPKGYELHFQQDLQKLTMFGDYAVDIHIMVTR